MQLKPILRLAAAMLAVAPCWGEWVPAGPWGGSATAVAIDQANPKRMLLGARNSLVYLSEDEGANWRRLNFPRHFLGTVRAVSFDPGNPRVFLAAVTGEQPGFGGVWRSVDGGETWTLPETFQGGSAEALARWGRDPRVMLAGTHQGVWRSEDGGAAWARISQPWNHEMRVVTAVAFDPGNRDVIYAGTPHLPWKSADGGKTWNSIHDGMLDDSDVFSIFVDPERPQRILASACSGIYRSETAGAKWSKFAGIPASHRRTHVIRQHPSQPNVIYAGTTLGLLRSSDGGATFRQLNNLHILSMVFHPADARVVYMATERGGLWRSRDGGVTAEAVNQGFVNRKVLNLASAGGRMYLNTIQDGNDGGVFQSEDGGATWRLAANAARVGDNHLHHLAGHPSEAGVLYAANERRLYRTADGGKAWRPLALPAAGHGRNMRITALALTGSGQGVSILLGTDHGLWRAGSAGTGWTLAGVTRAEKMPRVLSIVSAGERVVVRTTSTLYVSGDAGVSWRPVALLLPTSVIYDIALPAAAGDAMLIATAKGLYASDDGGRTWVQRVDGLEDGTVSTVRFHPGRARSAWLVQFGRLYESKDGGMKWRRVEGGEIAESSIRSLWTGPGDAARIYALTPDIGLFYLEVEQEVELR
ncbi:MAG: hypothetical protein C0504_12590 [Candidatus Solibacter sp.]|nr:hypothetical protein [Candidatus Solibacter sp.]